ncbi:MAG: cupin [Alphaproteobacteria bacterium]|nr:cupin [Alphaproteobacteria bacterium]
MQLNADFAVRAAVHGAELAWQASPMAGVERRMLERMGDEVARATTIVRYAPGSRFSPHVHTGGEEFLVLDGVFQDEHGDFPAGSYIRNPPQSSHTPGSDEGCTIFVKLWQFDMDDRNQVRLDTNAMGFEPDRERASVEVMPLFSDTRERVALERWEGGAEVVLNARNGLEVLVLKGGFEEGGERFSPQSWLRLPAGSSSKTVAGPAGVTVWTKRDHLSVVPQAPA